MKKLRRNHPIWVSLGLTLLFPLLSLVASLPLLLWDGAYDYGEYLPTLLAEVVLGLLGLGLMALLGMHKTLRPSNRPLREKLLPMLPVLLLYTYSLLGQCILLMGQPLQGPLQILCFVLCMLAVGFTEELFFRGLMTRMLYGKFGHSCLGVWLSVLVSSLLFGAVHLSNAVGGMVSLGSVLVQMVGAFALGLCLAATYLRSQSLWTVALIHAYIDFCGLVSSGLYTTSSISGVMDEISPLSLVMALFYILLAIFLLRPKKLRRMVFQPRPATQGEILMLMVILFLAAGLFSAVMVLSL